jgi:hypothetical protein
MVFDPLTKLQCCPTSDGAGAAILASEDFVKKHGLQKQAVEIAGMAMTSDFSSTFDAKSCIKLIGQDMTRAAAEKVYEQSGLGPENVQVIELHDCFSTNELVTYEGLGLCPEGKGGDLIESGAVTYGGKWVVNPSGGLISKGHPLGATGLAQCAELNWQLRGLAEKRQVPGREGRAAAQPGPRRCGGGDDVPEGRRGLTSRVERVAAALRRDDEDRASGLTYEPVGPMRRCRAGGTQINRSNRVCRTAASPGRGPPFACDHPTLNCSRT